MLPRSGKKHLETDFFSRSGKGQGVFGWSWKSRKYLKCQESSGNFLIFIMASSVFRKSFILCSKGKDLHLVTSYSLLELLLKKHLLPCDMVHVIQLVLLK